MNEIQTKTLYTRAQFPIKTEEEWLELNPVLRKGEIVFVQFFDGMKTAKIGDGKTPFYLLPYVDGPYEELETREFNNNILVNDNSMAETIRIDSFGGMTYKCSNLLPYSYYDTTTTRNGITFTVNSDNTITVNGKATATAHFDIVKVWDTCDIKAGTYCLSGVPKGGSGMKYYMNIAFKNSANEMFLDVDCISSKSFILEENAVAIYLRINIMSGTTVDNLVFAPMLNVGTTALPYESFKGLQDTKPTEIKVHGANLVDDVAFFENSGFVKQSNGYWLGEHLTNVVLFKNDSLISGAISLSVTGKCRTYNGTNASSKPFLFQVFYTDGSAEWTGGIAGNVTDYTTVTRATDASKTVDYIIATYGVGGTFEIKDIMFNIGATSISYTPYEKSVTIPIPQAIQALPNYGKGVDKDYYNKINLEEQTYTEQMETIVLDGVTNKFRSTNTYNGNIYFAAGIPYSSIAEKSLVCSHFITETSYEPGTCYITTTTLDLFVAYLQNQDITTVDEANAWLKEQYDNGNPVTITYAKADSIVTSIKRPTWSYKVPYGGFVEIVTNSGKTVPATGSLMYIRHRELDTKIEQLEETIESEINRLDNAIEQATNEVGSQISYINTRIDNLASYTQNEFAYIEGILEQFGVLRPSVSKKVSNIMLVPIRSTKYANINSFGGMTYKWEGITYTETLGTPYGIYSYGVPFTLQAGTYRLVGGAGLSELRVNNTIVNNPFTLEETTTINSFYEESGAIVGDGSTYTIYPYLLNVNTNKAIAFPNTWLGLQDTKLTEIKVHGANLIPYSAFGSTTTKNGITFTNNGDGTITVNGTATSATAFISNKFGINEGTYTISGCPTAQNGDLNITVRLYNEATQSETQWLLDKNNTPQSGTLTEPKTVSVAITVYSGTTVNNAVFKPMLNMGTTALPYTPYKEPVTLPIPDAIQNLPNYGKGVDKDYYNKINLEEQTYTERVETIVLDGVDNKFLSTGVTTDGTNRRWFASTPIQKPMGSTTLICSHLKAGHTSETTDVGIIYMAGTAPNNRCYALLQDRSITEIGTYDATTNTFDNEHSANAWLKEQYDLGNPVTVTYAKAKEATPITALPVALDGLIEVEPGGYIEFITDNNQPIPVEVEFQVVGEA